jgi:hypothetical protein
MRRASERSERTAQELAALEAWRTSTLVLFAGSVLLVTMVVAVAVGTRRVTTETTPDLAQAVITPQSLPTVPAAARATPDDPITPTPRVIVVAEPTPTPRPRAAATPSPRRTAAEAETPPPRAIPAGTPPPSAASNATVTATPAPAATPRQTVTAPTTPQPSAAAPAAAGSAAVIPAAVWEGAYRPRDALHFGRPWVAIYGDLSVYPRATAFVRLDVAPTGPATLTLTGIDDEWLDLNPIAVEVNRQQVFTGASPFANWDGTTTGAPTPWTPVTITIAPELLRAGRNRIAIANLSPSITVGSPPYVLLGDASLQVPGATVTVLAPEPEARTEGSAEVGGQHDDDGDDG